MTPAELLMSHAWYPYQNEYKTIDSSFVYPAGNPYATPVISVTHSDSTALFSECGQQTLYNFKSDAVLHVTSTCPNLPADVTTTWQLSQTNQMSMYLVSAVFLGSPNFSSAYGPITNLTTHSFILTTISTSFVYYNDAQTSTARRTYYTQLTTFKSR